MSDPDDEMVVRQRVQTLVKATLGTCVDYVALWPMGGLCVSIKCGSEFTFDHLCALALALNTTHINFRFKQGFCGSDVTPADPDEFELVVHNWSLPQ